MAVLPVPRPTITIKLLELFHDGSEHIGNLDRSDENTFLHTMHVQFLGSTKICSIQFLFFLIEHQLAGRHLCLLACLWRCQIWVVQ